VWWWTGRKGKREDKEKEKEEKSLKKWAEGIAWEA
jgi:hypothetical protein